MVKIANNPAYLRWIRRQPCCVCGHVAGGRYFRYNAYKDKLVWRRRLNAAHHVGDGIHHSRNNDELLVPLCDKTCSNVKSGCHEFIHKDMKFNRNWLTPHAERYLAQYKRQRNK